MISFPNFKKKILVIILGFFIASLIFIEYQNFFSIKNNYVLKINGKKISNFQFNQEIKKELFSIKKNKQSENFLQSLSEKEKYNIRFQVLSRLINETLLAQYAQTLGMKVNDQDIKKWIFSTKIFFSNNKFDEKKFRMLINNMGFTFNQYIDFIKEKILTYNFLKWIKDISFLTPIEIEQFIHRITQIRIVRLAKVDLKKICENLPISSEEAYHYYKLNKNKFFFPEKFKISFILISPKNLEKNVIVNKKDIFDWCKKNIKNSPSKKREFLKNFISRKRNIIPSYLTILENSSNKLKNIIETDDFSFTDTENDQKKIIYLQEKKPSLKQINKLRVNCFKNFIQSIPFSEDNHFTPLGKKNIKYVFPMKDINKKIISLIKKKKSIDLYNRIQQELLTNFNGTLSSIKKISGIEIKHTKWFDCNHLPQEINNHFLKKIFSEGDLLDIDGNYNNNYHIILGKDKQIFLIRIEKYKPKMFKTFDIAKKEIQNEIRINKSFERSVGIVEKMISEVNQNKKNESIFKNLNIKFSSKKYFRYKSSKNSLEKEIFSIPFSQESSKSTYKIFKDHNGNFFLISLDSLFQDKIDKLKREFLIKELKKYYENEIYNCFMNQLYNDAKIKIKESILSNFFLQE